MDKQSNVMYVYLQAGYHVDLIIPPDAHVSSTQLVL